MKKFSNLFQKKSSKNTCDVCQSDPCLCPDSVSNTPIPSRAASTNNSQNQQQQIGPTGIPLPSCDLPLVSYMGSPYGVAPNFICDFPKDIEEPVKDLATHMAKLSKPIGQFGPIQFDGFDIEFKYLEILETKREPLDLSSATKESNLVKNRYANILPPEHTRVLLSCENEEDNYINANYVSGSVEKRYIASQGPLPNTFNDFWLMVWQQNACVILMLTREIEQGVMKCARYWPEPEGEAILDHDNQDDETFLKFPSKEELNENNHDHSIDFGDIHVRFLSRRAGDEFVVRLFELKNNSTEEIRRLTMLQYVGWPDHGIPASPQGFVTLSRLADLANESNFKWNLKKKNKKLSSREISKMKVPPLIAHCSAGVGRTGTFITIHSLLEKVKIASKDKQSRMDWPPAISILQTIYQMRGERPLSVQTPDQYRFCYLSLDDQINKIEFEKVVEEEEKQVEEKSNTNSSKHRHRKRRHRHHHHHRRRKH